MNSERDRRGDRRAGLAPDCGAAEAGERRPRAGESRPARGLEPSVSSRRAETQPGRAAAGHPDLSGSLGVPRWRPPRANSPRRASPPCPTCCRCCPQADQHPPGLPRSTDIAAEHGRRAVRRADRAAKAPTGPTYSTGRALPAGGFWSARTSRHRGRGPTARAELDFNAVMPLGGDPVWRSTNVPPVPAHPVG